MGGSKRRKVPRRQNQRTGRAVAPSCQPELAHARQDENVIVQCEALGRKGGRAHAEVGREFGGRGLRWVEQKSVVAALLAHPTRILNDMMGIIQYRPTLERSVGEMTAKASCAAPGWYTKTISPYVQHSEIMTVMTRRTAMAAEPKLVPIIRSTSATIAPISAGTRRYKLSCTSSVLEYPPTK